MNAQLDMNMLQSEGMDCLSFHVGIAIDNIYNKKSAENPPSRMI